MQTAIDLASVPRFEIVTEFWPGPGPMTYSLLLHSAAHGTLEFGVVDFRSGVMFARRDGRAYVGCNFKNPGSFDGDGRCIEQHAMGVTMGSLLALLATPADVPITTFETSDRRDWNAAFELLSEAEGALRFRVCLSVPFAGTRAATFRDEYVMHEFEP